MGLILSRLTQSFLILFHNFPDFKLWHSARSAPQIPSLNICVALTALLLSFIVSLRTISLSCTHALSAAFSLYHDIAIGASQAPCGTYRRTIHYPEQEPISRRQASRQAAQLVGKLRSVKFPRRIAAIALPLHHVVLAGCTLRFSISRGHFSAASSQASGAVHRETVLNELSAAYSGYCPSAPSITSCGCRQSLHDAFLFKKGRCYVYIVHHISREDL